MGAAGGCSLPYVSDAANDPLLLVVPNLSEGRRPAVVEAARTAIEGARARVLDVHADPVHDRSVLTAAGGAEELVAAAGELAIVAQRLIDLRRNRGVHPRVGALDVLPFVPIEGRSSIGDAIAAARRAAAAIAERGMPVYLYGDASDPPKPLPEVRRSAGSISPRAAPDLGPDRIDPSTGAVCVGARHTLIAFNVWLEARPEEAGEIARAIREKDGGLPGVRALGLPLDASVSQVSMNLTDPPRTGIDAAFEAVRDRAERAGIQILRTEIVGLVPERFLPDPDMQAARLLMQPGRSLDSVLATI